MQNKKQKQTVKVPRGLFLIRYTDAEDKTRPPRITVSSGTDPDIELHLHPDHQEAALWQPGSCLIVEAKTPAQFDVEVSAVDIGGSDAATVKIETLTQGKLPVLQTQPLEAKPKVRTSGLSQGLPVDLSRLRILGHLAGRGDVWAKANEWLGGPTAPARLEGIALEWPDKPSGLEIRYAVKTAKPQPNSGRTIGLGSFAGTRGKSMPITSLMLELVGPQAATFQLSAEAIFLGSPTKRFTGKRVVASGPTGREPLVGLRLSLGNQGSIKSPPKTSARKSGKSPGGVRVFRSRARANQPATVSAPHVQVRSRGRIR